MLNLIWSMNERGIWSMKSVFFPIIQSRLHSQTYTLTLFIHMLICVQNDQRQFNCSTGAFNRMKFQGESEFFCLNNRSFYWMYWLSERKIVRWQSTHTYIYTYAHKGMLVVVIATAAAAFNWIYCLFLSL